MIGPDTGSGSGHDGQCMYDHHGQRCPFPGNINTAGHKWLCRWHCYEANLGDTAMQDEFFRAARLSVARKRQLAEWYPADVEAMRQTIEDAHPEWAIADGEAPEAYNERMFAEYQRLRRRRAAA